MFDRTKTVLRRRSRAVWLRLCPRRPHVGAANFAVQHLLEIPRSGLWRLGRILEGNKNDLVRASNLQQAAVVLLRDVLKESCNV